MSQPETLYDCLSVLALIDEKAEANDGELTEEDMRAIVVAQTTSMDKLSSLIGYIKHLEAWQSTCKAEEQRIYKRRKTAENRLQSIKRFLTPYIEGRGTITVETVTLSLRKSQAVELEEGFYNEMYGKNITTFVPDKKQIKEFLKANPDTVIKGAELVTRQNLQIK